MKRLSLLLAPALLFAQTIAFSPQSYSRIPGLREITVTLKNPAADPVTRYSAMNVMLAGQHQNLRLYYPTNLSAYVQDYNRRSPWRRAGVIVEVVGWPMVSGMAAERIKIKERWLQELLSLVPGVVTVARTIKDQEYQPIEVPRDALPPLISIPARDEVVYAVWSPEE